MATLLSPLVSFSSHCVIMKMSLTFDGARFGLFSSRHLAVQTSTVKSLCCSVFFRWTYKSVKRCYLVLLFTLQNVPVAMRQLESACFTVLHKKKPAETAFAYALQHVHFVCGRTRPTCRKRNFSSFPPSACRSAVGLFCSLTFSSALPEDPRDFRWPVRPEF